MNNYNFGNCCCSCICSSSSRPYWDSNLWLYTLLLNGCRSRHKFPLLSYFPKLRFRFYLFTFLPFCLFSFPSFPFCEFPLLFSASHSLPAFIFSFHSSLLVFLVELISFQLRVPNSV